MSTTVEDIVSEWMDDNGHDIIRDEIDVEAEIENQVRNTLDEIDLDDKVDTEVRYAVAKLCDSSDYNDKVVRLEVAERRLDDHREFQSLCTQRLNELETKLAECQIKIKQLQDWQEANLNRTWWNWICGN